MIIWLLYYLKESIVFYSSYLVLWCLFWFKVTKFICVILIRLELNLTSNTLKSSFIHYILKFGHRSNQVNSRVFKAMFGNFHLFLILIIDNIDLPFKQTKTIRVIVSVFQRLSTNDFALWVNGDLLHTDEIVSATFAPV